MRTVYQVLNEYTIESAFLKGILKKFFLDRLHLLLNIYQDLDISQEVQKAYVVVFFP